MAALISFLAAQALAAAPIPIADIVLPPSAAVRSETLRLIRDRPAEPIRYRMICRVLRRSGTPVACLPANSDVTSLEQFEAAARAKAAIPSENSPAGRFEAIARMRVLQTRVRLSSLAPGKDIGDPAWTLRLFEETVAAADALTPPKPAEIVTISKVTVEARPDPAIVGTLYPPRSIRDNVSAIIVVLCRLDAAHALQCHSAQVRSIVPAAAATPATNHALPLILASYQAASLYRVSPKLPNGSPLGNRDIALVFDWKPTS